jgi:hypothetical protein
MRETDSCVLRRCRNRGGRRESLDVRSDIPNMQSRCKYDVDCGGGGGARRAEGGGQFGFKYSNILGNSGFVHTTADV